MAGMYPMSSPRLRTNYGAPGMYQPQAQQAMQPMMSGESGYDLPRTHTEMLGAPSTPSYSMAGSSNSPAATSAPFAGMGYQQQLGMANRGQMARGPSPGFASMSASAAAQGPFGAQNFASQLPQFGETGRDVQNYRDSRSMTMDANQRANQFGMAQSGLMDAQAGGIGAQAGLMSAQGRGIDTTAPAEAALLQGQAKQAGEMPGDFRSQLAQHQRDNVTLRAENDRLNQQIRLYQQQGSRPGGKIPQLTQGEADALNDMVKGGMDREAAQGAIMKMRGQGQQQGAGFVPNSTADMRSVGGAANTPVQEDNGRDRASQQGGSPDPATTQQLTDALNPNRPSVSSFNGKQLDAYTAQQYLNKAGGDKEKARAMAKQEGYQF